MKFSVCGENGKFSNKTPKLFYSKSTSGRTEEWVKKPSHATVPLKGQYCELVFFLTISTTLNVQTFIVYRVIDP